jgi:PPOX class probable F420-dependent enzyme, Rv0121 family
VQAQRIAHLATTGADAWPHAIPICFIYLDSCFYSAIDEKPKRPGTLRRVRNIRENSRVALIFDRYDEDWTKLCWVLVRGAASILLSGAEHEAAVDALRDKYPQYRAMALAGRQLIKVVPQSVSSWGQALPD